MDRQETLDEIQRLSEQWVKTSGGNSQVVKPEESMTTQTPGTVITVTFSSLSQPGRELVVRGTPMNIHMKFSDLMLFFCNHVLDGDSGLIAVEHLDYVDLRDHAPAST